MTSRYQDPLRGSGRTSRAIREFAKYVYANGDGLYICIDARHAAYCRKIGMPLDPVIKPHHFTSIHEVIHAGATLRARQLKRGDFWDDHALLDVVDFNVYGDYLQVLDRVCV